MSFVLMTLTGGAYDQTYNLHDPDSPIQLEKGLTLPISQRSSSMIARDPFNDVLITLPLQAVGTSEDHCLNEYNKFVTFIQQIAQFRLTPDRHGIVFTIQTTATAPAMSTLATGSADYNPLTPIISQPTPVIQDALSSMYRMPGIKVSFKAKGRPIDSAAPDSGSAIVGTTNTPHNGRESFAIFASDYETDSPMAVTISLPETPPGTIPGGHLFVSNPYQYSIGSTAAAYESYAFLDARHLGTASGGFTALADTVGSTYPYSTGSTSLLRWVAPDNDPHENTGDPGSAIGLFRDFLCMGLVRGMTAGATATLQYFIQNAADGTRIYSKIVPVGVGAELVNMGVMSAPAEWENYTDFLIGVIFQNTSATLGTFWLDTFIHVNLNVANLAYIKHGPLHIGNIQTFTLDQRYLSATSPRLVGYNYDDEYTFPAQVVGNMHMSRRNQVVRGLWITPAGNIWRVTGDDEISMNFTSWRAGLSPLGEV